jgi:hypothetical protein
VIEDIEAIAAPGAVPPDREDDCIMTSGSEIIDRNIRELASARKFMEDMGLKPTSDAVDQLIHAFVPALRIMCDRGYDPKGGTWQEGGWMPILIEVHKKTKRLWYRCWRRGIEPWTEDHPVDLINYCGMLIRAGNLSPWGQWGAPYDYSDGE